MGNGSARQSEEAFRRARIAEQDSGMEQDSGGTGTPDLAPPALLRSYNQRGHGNGPVRAAAMQMMQQTHGNRAVQRQLHREVAVQRDSDPDEVLRRRQRPAPSSSLSAAELMRPMPLTLRNIAAAGRSPQAESQTQASESNSDAENEEPGVQVPLGNNARVGVGPSGANVQIGGSRANTRLGVNPTDGTVSVRAGGVAGRGDTEWEGELTANPSTRDVEATGRVGRWSGRGNITFNGPAGSAESEGGSTGPVESVGTGVTYRPRNMPAVTASGSYNFNDRQTTLGVRVGAGAPSPLLPPTVGHTDGPLAEPLDGARSASDPAAAALAMPGLAHGISEGNEQSRPQPDRRPAPYHPEPPLNTLSAAERAERARASASLNRMRAAEEARRRANPLNTLNGGAQIVLGPDGQPIGAGGTVGFSF